MPIPDRMQTPSKKAAEYWVKSPGAVESFGPVGAERLSMLIRAGIVRDDSLISDGDTDFLPVGRVKLEVLAVPAPTLNANPKVAPREPIKPEAPADHAGENRFASGYETLDIMRFNRMLEKEPELNLPSRWKDPRMRDKIRFAVYGSMVTAVFAYALVLLNKYDEMGHAGIAGVVWLMGMGLVGLVVFVLFPTRPGF